MTIKGYTKIFESCENISNVFTSLQSLNGQFNVNHLVGVLNSKDYMQTARCIFRYCDKILKNEQSMNSDDYTQIIETLSLLENVFRNVLLRPYIPAYRTINQNCGRYRCYINYNAEELFKTLGFEKTTDNLFTYTEIDLLKTVIYAVTCTCFWNFFTWKLDSYTSRNQSTRQTGKK